MPTGTVDGRQQRSGDSIGGVELPTQSPREVCHSLRDYPREDVERLFRAVWPGREPLESRSDLETEAAANMPEAVRHTFTNRGLEAAVEVAEETHSDGSSYE